MDYDYVAAEQNLSAYGVVDGHHHHRGGEEDEYEEENQRENYYSEHGVGIGLGGGGGGEMGPMDSIGDNGNAGHDLKHSMDDSSAGKLFVGGIAWETSEESFKRYFSKFGELTDSVIMMDKATGRPRGFGFVTFADAEAANKALDVEHILDGRTVEVKRTVPREDLQSSRGGGVSRTKKIFIGGIPLSLSEDDMREYFSAYGNVVEHQIMLDHKTGRSRGFGFVTFDSEEAVDKIFVDGQMHELGGKQVEIKRAEPKRSGFDTSGDSRVRRGGMNSKPYGAYSGAAGGSDGFGGGYGGKMGRGYGAGAGAGAGYGGFGAYGGYGNYPANYGAGAAGFYGAGGFGGYGYGFGFGGPMYGGAAGYGAGAYGNPAAAAGYGGAAAYGAAAAAGAGGRGYGAGYDTGKGYGASGGAAGYRGGSSGGSGGSGGGSSSGSKGYRGGSGSGGGGGAADGGRFHPYSRK